MMVGGYICVFFEVYFFEKCMEMEPDSFFFDAKAIANVSLFSLFKVFCLVLLQLSIWFQIKYWTHESLDLEIQNFISIYSQK